jgi:ABC-2 type transport system permease protein
VRPDTASRVTVRARKYTGSGRTYAALAGAGFRRYATYRQATIAGASTNIVFGFLRCYALLAVAAGAGGVAAGYDAPKLATYVWASQGMLAVVYIWGWPDFADRVRTGEVVADLLRPVDPVFYLLAIDLGRAGFALLTRFVAPMVAGALAFDLYAPRHPVTYPLFALSLVLAVLVCFGCRHVVYCSVYWLMDIRGPHLAWSVLSSLLAGLYLPLWLLPEPLPALLEYGKPFPAMVQTPMDVLTERGPAGPAVARQAGWVVVALVAARLVQRRAERRLVVQGG